MIMYVLRTYITCKNRNLKNYDCIQKLPIDIPKFRNSPVFSVFRCERHSYTVAVDGLDFQGHPFRRMFTIHCVGFIPTFRK